MKHIMNLGQVEGQNQLYVMGLTLLGVSKKTDKPRKPDKK